MSHMEQVRKGVMWTDRIDEVPLQALGDENSGHRSSVARAQGGRIGHVGVHRQEYCHTVLTTLGPSEAQRHSASDR